ncbi:hypothetical protein ABKV19_000864 [Rosa sericea]
MIDLFWICLGFGIVRTATMEENEDGGVYYDCYKVSPSLTYSVDICKGVLCNVDQLKLLNLELTSVLLPGFAVHGLVCKLKGDQLEVSIAPNTKPPQYFVFKRAEDALFVVSNGLPADLALKVLSGDMEIAAHHMKHSRVNQEVLHKRHINFIRLHREYELGRKLPCAVLEHYEHYIFLVANPIVRRLMGQLIMRYIFGGSDFERVANEKVQYYERYKDRPCRFLSMTPVYTFRDDATMEAPNDEMRNLNLKS